MPCLAIDFGTSNSALAVLETDGIRRLTVEDGQDTLPTAVFFPEDGSEMRIGRAAGEALIEGDAGRYMRALKSVLGTELLHEERRIGRKRQSLAQIITIFLIRLREEAEAQTGVRFTEVLSGRPVAFHDDPQRHARAEADLRACYLAAGFETVRFLPEPEAAALAAGHSERASETGLIIDIGGGTSDFSVYRREGKEIRILASHGIRLGGTDFDHALSLARAMPELGLGGTLKREMGDGTLPVPRGIYVDLSRWEKIPFVYTPETRRLVADMARNALDPLRIGRLARVVDEQLGHELAFAVESGKIAANSNAAQAAIRMGMIEPKLEVRLTRGMLNAALSQHQEALRNAIYQTLMQAQLAPQMLDAVVLVGGSSLMALVAEEAQSICPNAQLRKAEAFTAVIDGLALATANFTP
ncbi:Hsp70 family protein [Thioclava sp. GXIMD4216]|uniref:Hsp70 family protein n=1 Tax=Thioclava litoralis TaxID=3076557 RepID=A0ABZ1DYA9_9RHOB|nr:Hsp70 family protein [Thioclava sp. FTW29]